MVLSRRNFLRGMVAAPAIVAIDHIMPVKAFEFIKPLTPGFEVFDPIMVGLIRRAMPNTIARDIISAQPMQAETGSIFAMKSRYKEACDAGFFYCPYIPLQISGADWNSAEYMANSIREAEDKRIVQMIKEHTFKKTGE